MTPAEQSAKQTQSVLSRLGRFDRLADDAPCLRRGCGRPMRDHRPGSYGQGLAKVEVLSVCPA